MVALKLSTNDLTFKLVKDTWTYLHLLSYDSCASYNKCEYYYKLYPLSKIQFIEGTDIEFSELLKQNPTDIAYSLDGTYLKVRWDNHTILFGSYPNGKVKSVSL